MDDIIQRFRRLYMDPNYRGADGFTKDEDIMLLSLFINIGPDYHHIAAFQHLELIAHHPLGWIVWIPMRIELPEPQAQKSSKQYLNNKLFTSLHGAPN